ncbi:pyridoxamine 5'-phosphate oxidase [Jiella pelagia]|uniref:Pyridoxine/pyridoxamine 5'-phosphate oxidase n=1 Tax=Jiella pelagia TaxID=2986949 RepID=A0ABY7BYK2_9HYPH|nr:pyridoxamine 5'-phosphate oxidase [Jiella pelagia]WAP68619.1 pyridoxamine 5'-phosphate oxidase [Jiella pelagia]
MTDEPLTLDETLVGADPVAFFAGWLDDAGESEPNDPNAVSLASVDEDGMPDVRIVLLKGFDARGFAFYTNFESAKGRQLLASPKAAMCFHWKSRRRQVRLRGPVEVVSEAEADAYYASRHPVSRIGAWASQQSRPLESRASLVAEVERYQERYGEGEIPRPPHWSGFRLMPLSIEFWQDGAFRLHDRIAFTRTSLDAAWTVGRLHP